MDRKIVANVTLQLLSGDITDQDVDAIVNAANSSLMGGGGVDGAIHRRGGNSIVEACKQIREERYPEGLPTGKAVMTPAGLLPAKFVIHVVGPIWKGGHEGEPELLEDAYTNALREAQKASLRTIAFPSISTGIYNYPVEQAAGIALCTVASFVTEHPDSFREVRFILFSEADYITYQRTLSAL